MSHVDSKDDEVKSILAEIDSNDSKESDSSKKDKKVIPKNDEYNEYDISDDKEADDKEW